MTHSYKAHVDLLPLTSYLVDSELTSRLYRLFDVIAKPWQKCWAFDITMLIGKPLGVLPSAVLFHTAEQAQRFVDDVNQQFDIVMTEALTVELPAT